MSEYRGQNKPLYGTPINPLHWASNGLVGQWTMNEGSGLIAHDSSGNVNHGTLTNMSNTPTSGWVPGPHGAALAFDGGNDYVKAPMPAISAADSFSLCCFIKSAGNSLLSMIFEGQVGSQPSLEGTDLGYQFYVGNTAPCSTGIIISGQWHYIVCTFNKITGVRNIYIDGKYKSTNTSTTSLAFTNLYLGARGSGNSLFWNGLISSVSIYNRALSAEEIAYLYQNPWCMYEDQSPISLQGGNASAMNYYQKLLAGGQ